MPKDLARNDLLASQARYAAPGDEPLAVSASLTLNEPFRIDRGLAKRLRMREVNAKEAFTLRDSAGGYFRASLKSYDPQGGVAIAYERMSRSPESVVDLTLACAILARQRMQLVMQGDGAWRAANRAAAEGPLRFRRGSRAGAGARVAGPHRAGGETMSPVIAAASPASGYTERTAYVPFFATTDLRLFLDDRSDVASIPTSPPRRIILFVGPEGGFSDGERRLLSAHARPWVLGGRVLRAETAVLVGLTAAQMTWGDFREQG